MSKPNRLSSAARRRPAGRALVGLALGGVAVLAVGCLSREHAEKQRHVLSLAEAPVAVATAGAADGLVLRVDRVRVSELFERKGFVYRTGETTYEEDFYNEFFLQPAALMRRAAQSQLAATGLFAQVLDGSDRGRADWALEVWVPSLYADLRTDETRAVLVIEYVIVDTSSPHQDLVLRRRYDTSEPVASRSAAAILAGWNRGMERSLAALAADLGEPLSLAAAAR